MITMITNLIEEYLLYGHLFIFEDSITNVKLSFDSIANLSLFDEIKYKFGRYNREMHIPVSDADFF